MEHLANMGYTPFFFYQNNLIRTKASIFAKKIKKKLRTQSLVCCPTEHKNKVPRPAILKIIRTKHQNRAWLPLHVD